MVERQLIFIRSTSD